MLLRLPRLIRRLAVAGIAIAALSAEAGAQTTRPAAARSEPALPADGAPATGPAPASQDSAAPPLPGPKLESMRWNENFSYLDGPPGSYQEDFFDPIKNIRLDDDWRLILGGALRARFESRTNKAINTPDPTQDTVLLHRTMLHADLRYRKLFRFYAEGIHAAIEDNDGPFAPGDENNFDFHQFFVDFRVLGEETPLTFRAGRQEIEYGKGRVIAAPEFSMNRRRFDGFKLFWNSPNWNADLFYLHPLPEPGQSSPEDSLDRYDDRQYMFGTYVTYKGIPQHELDFSYIYYRNANDPVSGDGSVGSLGINHFGARFGGRIDPWDYDAEVMGQFGDFAGDTVQAWAFAADGGYTIPGVQWKPRLGTGVDYASGDSHGNDGKHQRYSQLFPSGHSYLGFIDIVGRQNIWAANVSISAEPVKNVKPRLAYYAFWLAENEDGLFNPGGGLLRRDTSGQASHDVGHELDFTIDWKLDVHTSLLLGWSHFWTDAFIDDSGLGDDADYIYLQYQIKF